MSSHQSNSVDYWFQRTIESLRISGKSKRTAETYAREVHIMGRWLSKPLDQATAEDVRKFYLYRLIDKKLSDVSMRILICGIRELFTSVLGKEWPVLEHMHTKRLQKLPIVMERDEIWKIIAHSDNLCHRTYLTLVYTCGLRLSEAVKIMIHDIDGKRMRIQIRQGKGGKDRYVPLPKTTYLLLRQYWPTHKNPRLLFPALGRGGQKGFTATKPMPTVTVQSSLRRAADAAGLHRPGLRIHTLRHCFATHLLEAGINVHAIQKYMGHSDLSTTLRYFHLTKMGLLDNEKILNDIMNDQNREDDNA